MTRLFVALNIPAEIKSEIDNIRREAEGSDISSLRWEKDDKIHLTLKFIGDVEDDLTEDIKNSLMFLEDFSAINCKLGKFGCFRRNGVPNILWLGLDTDKVIYDIVSKLNDELTKFDIQPEKKKFRSHLTLLRIKDKMLPHFIEGFESYDVPQISFIADSISLIESKLLKSGSVYTEVYKYVLKS
ncbi:MAG: RNA 2',3'-cyclic phosphodiesterase [Bacteroidota bacterium]|nr:RNA 2',3'-cyclic phosphodiesterase [Bacteroidota bacterium]